LKGRELIELNSLQIEEVELKIVKAFLNKEPQQVLKALSKKANALREKQKRFWKRNK